MFTILKDVAGVWWHLYNNNATKVHLSDFDVIIEAVAETFVIEPRNGSNIPSRSVSISDVQVINESISSSPISFTGADGLIALLTSLNYPPYLSNTTPQPPVKVWTKGDAISINRTQTWIDANFDVTGLGINEMVGWAKRNGQNGTRDAQDRSLLNQGTKFANVGIPYGFENTVLVAHEADSAVLVTGGVTKKGVNDAGTGPTVNGYTLVSGTALGKVVKTSKVGQDHTGAPSTVETGVGKNYHPILVELFIERVEDLWIMGGSALPNLPQVLTQGGRTVKVIDTSDPVQCPSGVYTLVITDAVDYLYFINDTPVEVDIVDDFFDYNKGVELLGSVQEGGYCQFKYNGSSTTVTIDCTSSSEIKFSAHLVETNIWAFGLSKDTLENSVDPVDLISTDADNALVLGLDNKLFVPESTGGGVESVTGDLVDNTDPLNPIVETPNLIQVLTQGDITPYTIPIPNNTFVTFDLGRELTENYFITDDVGTGGVFLDKDVIMPDNATIRWQAGYIEDNVTPTDVTLLPYRFTTDAYVFYQGARVTDITLQPEDVCMLKLNGKNSTDLIQIWHLTVVSKSSGGSVSEYEISTAKIINRCPADTFRNAHGDLKIGTVQYYGTRTNPSDLLRFPDLNDLSVFQKITLPSSGLGTIEYLAYNETLGKIYSCLSTNKLLVINDIDDISDYDIIDLTLSQGTILSGAVIFTDDDYIYIGTNQSPNAYFIKLDATDYSEVENVQWTGRREVHSGEWNYDKSELYFVQSGNNCYVAVINPSDLSFTDYLAGYNVTDDIAYILDANSSMSFDSWLFLPSELRSLGDKGHYLFNLTTKERYALDGLPSTGCYWDDENFILYSSCINGFIEAWTGENLIASALGAINPKSASTVYVNKEGLHLNEITKISDRFFATAWNNEVENGGDGLGSLMELDLVNVKNGALSKKEEVIRNTFYINKEVSQALISATTLDVTFGEGYVWNLIGSKKFAVNISPEDSFTASSLDNHYISNKTEVSFRINFNASVTGTLNFSATVFPNY